MNRIIALVVFAVLSNGGARAQEPSSDIPNSEEQEILSLAAELNHTSLEYRAVATKYMLNEANYFSEKMRLPTPHPIRLSDLEIQFISTPWNSRVESTNASLSHAERIRQARFFVSGRIATTNFDFSFNGGRLFHIQRLKIQNENSIYELYPQLSKATSLVNSNEAYQLATQWLSSVAVDVSALEKAHCPNIDQWFFFGTPEDLPKDQWTITNTNTSTKTMLPLYDISWGGAVKVTVLGTTKELFELALNDRSSSKRAVMEIRNAVELNHKPERVLKPFQMREEKSLKGSNRATPQVQQ